MVDVTAKAPTERTAVARGVVRMRRDTFDKIMNQDIKKGNVLETARIAGIMGAKQTAALIPMCHPLNLSHVQVDFFPDEERHAIRIESRVRIIHRTGVEMEALTAVSVAARPIYDMCQSYDRAMDFTDICLLKNTGGKSGTFQRPSA